MATADYSGCRSATDQEILRYFAENVLRGLPGTVWLNAVGGYAIGNYAHGYCTYSMDFLKMFWRMRSRANY